MSCGLPVVNTDLDSGVPFVSLHNETGLTVPAREPVPLADAINILLADRATNARFAAAARNRVASEFTAAIMTRRTMDLYRDVLASREPEGLRQIRKAAAAVGADSIPVARRASLS
jgi:rhamnosyl/mannosyltransferase